VRNGPCPVCRHRRMQCACGRPSLEGDTPLSDGLANPPSQCRQQQTVCGSKQRLSWSGTVKAESIGRTPAQPRSYAAAIRHKSSGLSPVTSAERASIRGPSSSRSWKAKTTSGVQGPDGSRFDVSSASRCGTCGENAGRLRRGPAAHTAVKDALSS